MYIKNLEILPEFAQKIVFHKITRLNIVLDRLKLFPQDWKVSYSYLIKQNKVLCVLTGRCQAYLDEGLFLPMRKHNLEEQIVMDITPSSANCKVLVTPVCLKGRYGILSISEKPSQMVAVGYRYWGERCGSDQEGTLHYW